MEELFASIYQQNHSTINGRNVWHYLIHSSIGQYHIIKYEQKDLSLKEIIVKNSLSKAEKKYDSICIQLVKGTI